MTLPFWIGLGLSWYMESKFISNCLERIIPTADCVNGHPGFNGEKKVYYWYSKRWGIFNYYHRYEAGFVEVKVMIAGGWYMFNGLEKSFNSLYFRFWLPTNKTFIKKLSLNCVTLFSILLAVFLPKALRNLRTALKFNIFHQLWVRLFTYYVDIQNYKMSLSKHF